MQAKRVVFPPSPLPYLLVAPQLLVTIVFFVWPAGMAVWQALERSDAFGLSSHFVGLANFEDLFRDSYYLTSFQITVVFSVATTAVVLVVGLVLAVMAERVTRGRTLYTTLLIMPYAVAPAVAGVLWFFLFNPTIGVIARGLGSIGIRWNHFLDGTDAMILIIVASAWKQVSYNFLFFFAGLQSIPRSLIEAAAIDGAKPLKRFFTIELPLLAPTAFFLLVVDLVYAFFETFAVVDATTRGGPGQSTNTLVYKVYHDGFQGLNLGSSGAQSVVLMVIVIALTVIQFRYIERKVDY